MNKTFKEAFKVTMPVLLGYLSIGLAFGLMMQSYDVSNRNEYDKCCTYDTFCSF